MDVTIPFLIDCLSLTCRFVTVELRVRQPSQTINLRHLYANSGPPLGNVENVFSNNSVDGFDLIGDVVTIIVNMSSNGGILTSSYNNNNDFSFSFSSFLLLLLPLPSGELEDKSSSTRFFGRLSLVEDGSALLPPPPPPLLLSGRSVFISSRGAVVVVASPLSLVQRLLLLSGMLENLIKMILLLLWSVLLPPPTSPFEDFVVPSASSASSSSLVSFLVSLSTAATSSATSAATDVIRHLQYHKNSFDFRYNDLESSLRPVHECFVYKFQQSVIRSCCGRLIYSTTGTQIAICPTKQQQLRRLSSSSLSSSSSTFFL